MAADNGSNVFADFEGENLAAGNTITPSAEVTAVSDVPEGGDKFAAKTVVDTEVGAKNYFGTDFGVPTQDCSKAIEFKFWIKTDIENSHSFETSESTSDFCLPNNGLSSGVWPGASTIEGILWRHERVPRLLGRRNAGGHQGPDAGDGTGGSRASEPSTAAGQARTALGNAHR